MARKFLTVLIVLPGLLVACSAYAAVETPVIISDPAYTHAQRLVAIEPGRKLNLYCIGKGSPTVIFDSGVTDETSVWGLVQPVVSKHTRTCSHDRAGVGFSDPGNRASSSANIVDDLHRLLVAAKIKPPYVLVGHSYGGMNIKLYASTYPSEVVGMVFVDPSHEDQKDGYRKLDPRQLSSAEWDRITIEPSLAKRRECIAAAPAGFIPGTELYKKCSFDPNPTFSVEINAIHLKIYLQQPFQQAQLSEEESIFAASADQVRAARRNLGDIPLIVLTQSPNTRPLPAGVTQELRDARNNFWVSLHDDIASLSTQGVNRIVEKSGHNIPYDQPGVVNDAIFEVIKASKKYSRSGKRR